MLAVQMFGWGDAPRVVTLPEPQRAPGESLVRILAATVAHLDLTVASGSFPLAPPLPYIPGVEGAGEILESDRHPVGSRVTIRGAGVGMTQGGTWAEVVSVPDEALHPWPEGMSPSLASAYYVPATTAHLALHDVAALEPSDRVLVVGARGAVGSLVAQLARRSGASVVGLASGPIPAMDAKWLLDRSDQGIAADFAARRPFTLLVDTVGGPELAERLTWVTPGGRAVVVGYTQGTQVNLDLPSWLLGDVAVLPVNTITRAAAADSCAPGLARMLVAGDLTLATRDVAVSHVMEAIELLSAGKVGGRVVLVPEQ